MKCCASAVMCVASNSHTMKELLAFWTHLRWQLLHRYKPERLEFFSVISQRVSVLFCHATHKEGENNTHGQKSLGYCCNATDSLCFTTEVLKKALLSF